MDRIANWAETHVIICTGTTYIAGNLSSTIENNKKTSKLKIFAIAIIFTLPIALILPLKNSFMRITGDERDKISNDMIPSLYELRPRIDNRILYPNKPIDKYPMTKITNSFRLFFPTESISSLLYTK